MKIGIYISAGHGSGGVYQYSLAILESLLSIPGHKIVIFLSSSDVNIKISGKNTYKTYKLIGVKKNDFEVDEKKWKITDNIFTALFSVVSKLRIFPLWNLLWKRISPQKEILQIINTENIDLMIFPLADYLSVMVNVPIVVSVHDLQHRINPQFAEVSANGQWEYREYLYKNICKKAIRILSESDIGKRQIMKYYDVSERKIAVLPYLPPSYLNNRIPSGKVMKILKKYQLRRRNYIFYPAKFWPHKNHLRLIQSLSVLHKEGIKLDLVLTGSKGDDFDTFEKAMTLSKFYGLSQHIKYLGYLQNNEISAIYKGALALVMPTYFGPSNIPVIEAWYMGTPVIYSNIEGCREQLGKAGLLINPDEPSDIAAAIKKIYLNPSLAGKLIKYGDEKINNWNNKKFSLVLKQIINEINTVHN
jgi:glycosyltransferase involved in cell wall biosynthesis